jgi:hypothetical protein
MQPCGSAIDYPVRRTMNLWPDVGRLIGLSKNAVYEAAGRGEIPGLVRIGRRLLVLREPFERFLKEGPIFPK